MDQRLRLQAELRDNASPKIRQIAKELKEVRTSPGMEQTQKWFTGFNETAERFVKDGGGVAGTMGAIGIGGLTAAASLGELVRQFKELGDHTFAVKKLGQETGLTLDQVRKWEYVGQVFRVPVEQMDAALKTLGDQMVDFKRRRGELFGQLSQLDPKFAEKLQLEDTQHQLQDIFNWLGKIPDAAARNRWAKEFFGTDDLNNLLTNGIPDLNKAISDANRNVTPITAEMQKQADLFNSSIVNFNQAWQGFETQAGPVVFDQLRKALDDFRSLFDDIKQAVDWFQQAKEHPGQAVKSLGDAADKAFDDKAKEVGDRWRERFATLKQGHEGLQSGEGVDGNKLHYDDNHRPARRDGSGFLGAGYQHTAFVTGFESAGLDNPIAAGTKAGVLAAFQEWSMQGKAGADAGGGTGAGLINASYETDSGGFPRRGGSSGGGSGGPGSIGRISPGDAPASLLDLIRKGETGTTGPDGYKAITGQWHGERPDPTKMTVDQVLAFQHRMRAAGVSDTAVGGYQINGSTLKDFKSQMGLSGSEMFDADLQTRIAKQIAASTGGDLGRLRGRWTSLRKQSDSTILGAMSSGGGDVATRLRALKSAGVLSNEECVTLASASVGFHGSVHDWRKGEGPEAGGWKPGTPISTFLDRHGRETDRYAGGGSGTRGAHLDHAGVFESYIRDKNGKIVGFNMAEQYAGSGGIHSHAYPLGQGWGEGNGSNYHAVKGPDDRYLGGDENPMNHLSDLVGEARKAAQQAESQKQDGSIEAHIHVHSDGGVKGVTAKSQGSVATPRIQLRRGPTMNEPSFET